MVSWAAKKAKEHAAKKTKAHENRNLDGTYYSNAEKEDVHREEKNIITEERTKHLNDLKQQILERNSKLSEIERRAFAEAHTPKKKNFMDVEKKSLEFWASTDPHFMARQEELQRLEQEVKAEQEEIIERHHLREKSLTELRDEGDVDKVGEKWLKDQERKREEALRLAREESIRNGTYTPPPVDVEFCSQQKAQAMLEEARRRLEAQEGSHQKKDKVGAAAALIAELECLPDDDPTKQEQLAKARKKYDKALKKQSSKIHIDDEADKAKALEQVEKAASALAEAEALPDDHPEKENMLKKARKKYAKSLRRADLVEGDDGLVCTADGEPLPAKFQIKRGFSKRDKGSSFFYDAKALEEALDWDDGALYKAPAAAPAPSPTEAVAPPTSPHDVRASRASTCDSDVNAVIAQRVEEIVRASSPVAAEAPAPAPPRKRRRRKKKALAKVAAVDALLAEVNSPERKAQIEREQRRAEEEAAERAAAEKKATLQANSDSAKEIYRRKQAERRAKKAAKAAVTPAPAPAPAPAVGSTAGSEVGSAVGAAAPEPRKPRKTVPDELAVFEPMPREPMVPPPGAAAAFEDHACELHGCCVDMNGTRAVTGGEDGNAYVWDVSYPTCVPKQRLEAHSEVVAAVAITEDGRQVATAGRDNIVVLWVEEGRDYKNILTLKGHTSWVSSVVFSNGGHYLATGSYDETARVWSCTSGKELAMFHDDDVSNERGKPFVYDVAFSYDAKRLLVGGRDGVGRIWDCNIEDTFYVAKLLISLEAHASAVLAVAWSADGKRIATASKDRTCRVYSAKTGRILSVLQGHEGQVTSIKFYPADGRRMPDGRLAPPVSLATASRDATIRFWRVAPETRGLDPEEGSKWNATCGAILRGHVDRISGIAFDATGASLVSAGFDRKAIVWDVQQSCRLGTAEPPEPSLDDATVDAPTVGGVRGE